MKHINPLMRWQWLWCCLLLVQAFTASAEARLPVAQRIVSLDLCMDWMLVYHLDSTPVAALSPLYQRYPLPIQPVDWPVHDGSVEQIFSLQPDLVLVGEYNAPMLRSRLQRLGLPVQVVQLPRSLAEVVDYEQQLLALLGLPQAQASPAPVLLAAEPGAPRLLLLGANGIGTGRGTFEDQILVQAGWQNYLTESGYLRLDLEQLVNDPPDALLWAAPGSAALANRFAEHPALLQRIPAARWLTTDYWRWQCPGPWTWELIEQLKQAREALD